LGIAPQDVKQFSDIWWYELIINIIAVVVLIGLGTILPGIRRREVEYGIAFSKKQWIIMLALIIGSIVLDVYLGGTKLALRGLYIFIEACLALLICWVVGRKKPIEN